MTDREIVELVNQCGKRVCSTDEHHSCPFGNEGMVDCVERLEAAYDETIRNLLNIAEEREWIREEIELPSDDRMVLCIASGKVGEVTLKHATELGFYTPQDGWVLETWPEAENITVEWWMELPQPPEEIKEETTC